MRKLAAMFIAFSLALTGCEAFYRPAAESELVTQKRTHRTFEQLKEPIVLTMPVYEYSYLFGNKEWSEKARSIGDIFVIYDCEKNEVYDWAFFDQYKYVTDGRVVEQKLGGKMAYHNFGYWSDTVATITPDTEEIGIVKCNVLEGNWSFSTCTEYCVVTKSGVCLSEEDEKAKSKDVFRAYNTLTKSIEPFEVNIYHDRHISWLKADNLGRFWGSYAYDKRNSFFYIDYRKGIMKTIDTIEQNIVYTQNSHGEDVLEGCDLFKPIYADEDFIVFATSMYGNIGDYSKYARLRIYSLEDFSFVKEIKLDRKETIYAVSIFEAGGKLRIMLADGGDLNIYVTEFSYDMDVINPGKPLLNFWYTCNVFPRGDKLFLVHSGYSKNYSITYYDFAKEEQGPVVVLDADKITGMK